MQQENENRMANGAANQSMHEAKHQNYILDQSQTTYSHFSEESSDVESYHQSRVTHQGYLHGVTYSAQPGENFNNPDLHLKTHLKPFNH